MIGSIILGIILSFIIIFSVYDLFSPIETTEQFIQYNKHGTYTYWRNLFKLACISIFIFASALQGYILCKIAFNCFKNDYDRNTLLYAKYIILSFVFPTIIYITCSTFNCCLKRGIQSGAVLLNIVNIQAYQRYSMFVIMFLPMINSIILTSIRDKNFLEKSHLKIGDNVIKAYMNYH